MPKHEFLLVRIKDNVILNDLNLYLDMLSTQFNHFEKGTVKILEKVSIDDDIFSYFADYLLWIPIRNYTGEVMPLQCNQSGCGYFDDCSVAKDFLQALKKIFVLAPLEVKLQTYCSTNIDDCYVNLNKSDIINKLDNLLNMIYLAEANSDYIVHLGI